MVVNEEIMVIAAIEPKIWGPQGAHYLQTY